MGNNNSAFWPCYSQDCPSSRNRFEEFRFSSTGPVKVNRKKWSIATADTISIQPQIIGSNRSSVTEFVVERSESTLDGRIRINGGTDSMNLSVPCSPGRYQRNEAYSKNCKNKGINLVNHIRSKSVMSSPISSKIQVISPILKENLMSRNKTQSKSNKKSVEKKVTRFEAILTPACNRKLYY
jgi:hypothetical protein